MTNASSPTHTGRCLCGGIRFRIEGELAPVQICHCSQCRRAQGTPFATNTPVAESAFHLLAGADLLSAFESSPGKQRLFCRRCGSPVYSRKASLPGMVRIRAGLLDEPVTATLEGHFHIASKAGWWPLHDELPKHD